MLLVCNSKGALHEPALQVVLNITNTFDSSFSRWTVGLGIEHQLNELRVAAGLSEEARFRARARNLDYGQLVHPEVAAISSSSRLLCCSQCLCVNCFRNFCCVQLWVLGSLQICLGSSIHPFTQAHSSIHSFICQFIQSFVHSSMHSVVCPFIQLFACLFICPSYP